MDGYDDEDDDEQHGGLDPNDPMRGGKKKHRDKWWEFRDPKFQRWYHRAKKKERDYQNVNEQKEMQEYYDEWIARGKPEV